MSEPDAGEPGMRGERALLRLGELLVDRACRRLPRGVRADRRREWAAELPAILHDPEIRRAPRRAVRMLAYAADTLRGAARAPHPAWRRPSGPRTVQLGLRFLIGLAILVWNIWKTVGAPADGVNYLLMSWSLLLVANPVSQYVSSTDRLSRLALGCSALAGTVLYSWNAVQAPGDWVNYPVVLCFFSLLLLLLWLTWRSARTVGRHAGRPAR